MKRVLSVDVDVIMAPCCNVYNGKIDSGDWKALWKELLPEMGELNYDGEILKNLFTLFKQQDCEFYFIEDHNDILPFIIPGCSLYNIDFHHDIYYNVQASAGDTEVRKNTVGNWVDYAVKRNLIEEYTWVHPFNSNKFLQWLDIPYYEKDVSEIPSLGKFDRVVVCSSPQWVPPQYHNIYDVIKIMFDKNEVPKKE